MVMSFFYIHKCADKRGKRNIQYIDVLFWLTRHQNWNLDNDSILVKFLLIRMSSEKKYS